MDELIDKEITETFMVGELHRLRLILKAKGNRQNKFEVNTT